MGEAEAMFTAPDKAVMMATLRKIGWARGRVWSRLLVLCSLRADCDYLVALAPLLSLVITSGSGALGLWGSGLL